MKYHYTYRITNIKLNKHYYGSRTSSITPSEDIGYIYFSSSTDKDFIKDQKENPDDYKYKVIRIFEDRKDALELEVKLHEKFEVGANINFYNKGKQTSSGFSFSGRHHSEETKRKAKINTKIYWENLNEDEHKVRCLATSEGKKKSFQNEENYLKHMVHMENCGLFDIAGEKNGFYGKKHSKEKKEEMVNNRRNNNGGEYHPNGNVTAKRFLYISPEGEEFEVFNSSKKFCEEHKINVNLFQKYPNQIIKKSNMWNSRTTEQTKNSVGWIRIEL